MSGTKEEFYLYYGNLALDQCKVRCWSLCTGLLMDLFTPDIYNQGYSIGV
jgi:hypothetical protein